MSRSSYKVLVIDDDSFEQRLIAKCLESHNYQVKMANDGNQGLQVALDWLPDAILLDVEMPHKNGYEVCEILKSDPITVDIPVIFISANASQREKLLGFELGAEDYLVKPFEPDILNAKVGKVIAQHVDRINLNNRANLAQETAFEALTSSAELGRALRFSEHTYSITSIDSLARALFQTLNEFGLKTSCMFVTSTTTLFYSHNSAEISSFEKDLMEANHINGNRFTDFGCRTFCNFRQTCLLIKNMPWENPERYGRIKDIVPFILGAVDGKIRALDVHQALMRLSDSLDQSVDAVSSTLNALTKEVSSSHTAITEVMKNLLLDLEYQLPKMGLEDDQEKYLAGRIDQAFTEALGELDRSLGIGLSLSGVVRWLEHLHVEQEKMVRNTLISSAVAPSNLPNDGDTLSDDVEMF